MFATCVELIETLQHTRRHWPIYHLHSRRYAGIPASESLTYYNTLIGKMSATPPRAPQMENRAW